MLSIHLIPFQKAFIFQIVNQHNKLEDYLKQIGGVYYAPNGWAIRTGKAPEVNIAAKTIWLRGYDREQDLRIHRYWGISTDGVRDQYMSEIDMALQSFVINANVTKDVAVDWTRLDRYPMAGRTNH